MSNQQPVAAAVVTVVAAVPVTINIGGYEAEMVSLILAILTVVSVRLLFGFSDKSSGATRREVARTVLAGIFVFSYVLNYRPGPGVAVVVGAGIGISIAALLDIIGEWVVAKARNTFGNGGTKP